MQDTPITKKLINWYHDHGRSLPWRSTTDPYKIWLSEVILQQTRVNQGLPYYYKFVERYPTIEALANASEEEVLRLWQGLGYYSRARNLHGCAKILKDKYNNKFPQTYDELLKLPGIGKYTAAAIASFAFKEPVAAIDGNVFRVLARLFGVDDDIQVPKSRKRFEEIGAELISKRQPDTYNQAMMEFGAMVCVPKSPKCEECPLTRECFAREKGRQKDFPVKTKRVKVKNRYFTYLVLAKEDGIWMNKRLPGDIWQSMYDFYLIEETQGQPVSQIEAHLNNVLKPGSFTISDNHFEWKHVLSHQVIYARFITVSLNGDMADKKEVNGIKGAFYSMDEIRKLPKPVLVSRYLNEAIF